MARRNKLESAPTPDAGDDHVRVLFGWNNHIHSRMDVVTLFCIFQSSNFIFQLNSWEGFPSLSGIILDKPWS